MYDLWERFKSVIRQPEVIAAIATILFAIIREFVPALADVITLEWLIAIIGLLLGVHVVRRLASK